MGKRIIIVGLPLFAKRLAEDLGEYDPNLKVTALDTYYTKIDRIKALFLIPFCKVVYSINGTTSKSKVFDWAFFWNKKVMMTWVGTDVTKAINNKNRLQKYIDKAEHYCEVEWIQKELKSALNINAEILNFFNFKENKAISFPTSKNKLRLLTYIAKNRELYYGINKILSLARDFKDVHFDVVGTDGEGFDQYPNITFHGWVENMQPLFNDAHVTSRLIEHDGLSGFVLESLFNQKYVLYNNKIEGVIYIEEDKDAYKALENINEKFKNQSLKPNETGSSYIKNNFMYTEIMSNLLRKIKGN